MLSVKKKEVSKVFVIFTGGTFGMLRNKDNGKFADNTETINTS